MTISPVIKRILEQDNETFKATLCVLQAKDKICVESDLSEKEIDLLLRCMGAVHDQVSFTAKQLYQIYPKSRATLYRCLDSLCEQGYLDNYKNVYLLTRKAKNVEKDLVKYFKGNYSRYQ